jgi:excisionase family DNA binding protein
VFALSPQTATSIAPSTNGQGFVLFAQVETADRGTLVKIEGTRQLAARLRALDADNPLDVYLVGLIPTETPTITAGELHQRLASSRFRGEWFVPSPDVTSVIYSIAQVALHAVLQRFQPTSDDGAMLTVEDLAEQLGVSVPTVRRMVARGQVPHVRVGRQIRFRAEDVVASLRRR